MDRDQAKQLDIDLVASGILIEQLIEVAGLGVAQSIYAHLAKPARILVIAGPGNNGRDAQVAGRYLAIFGFEVTLATDGNLTEDFDYILDGLFGFSYQKRSNESSFTKFLEFLQSTKIPVISVDLPSSWDANDGNTDGDFVPLMVVSLSWPKKGMKGFKGVHYLAGRYLLH